jgi:hypothetical protein
MNDGRKAPAKEEWENDTFPRPKRNGRIDTIEISLKSDMICSNINRVAILTS